jgi:hypothetical protein
MAPSKQTVLKVFIAVALAQTAILIGVAVVGHRAYSNLDAKLSEIEPYTQIFTENEAPPEVVENLGNVLRAVVGDFIFGASNGQIAMFIANIMSKNFADLGATYENTFNALAVAMSNTTCGAQVAMCPADSSSYWQWPYPTAQCPAGSPQGTYPMQCYGPGQSQQCNDDWCAAPAFRAVAKYVENIARKLQEIPTLIPPQGTPAFSNGMFQLDGLFHWIRNQGDLLPWKVAAISCQALAPKIRSVPWDGCFNDQNGVQQCWNITSTIQQGVDGIKQFCDGFSWLPTQ